MKKFLLSITAAFSLTTFLTQETKAQTSGVNAQTNADAAIRNSAMKSIDNRYSGIQGSPYWYQQWLPGKIKFENNVADIEKTEIKYDPFASFVIVKTTSKDSLILEADKVKEFTLNLPNGEQGNIAFRKFPNLKVDDPKLKSTFFQVIQEGNTAALKNLKKTLLKANFKGGYSANRTSDEIISETNYYILKPDQSLIKVKLNRKSIIGALSDKESALSEYIKKEKLALQSEDDLKKVVNYYNSI